MSNLVCLPNTSSVSSVTLAEALGVLHKNLLRSMRKAEESCPDSIWRLNFEPSDYLDVRGKSQPGYEVSQDGLLLLLPFLPSNEAKIATVKVIAKMRKAAKESFKELKEAKKEITQLRNRLLSETGQLETGEYGTTVKKLEIPLEEKTMLVFDGDEDIVRKRIKVIEISRLKVANGMLENAEKRLKGVNVAVAKLESFVSALEQYYEDGDVELRCPTPKDFDIYSEYQERFEKDVQVEDFYE
jgi:Rha family phage regulatory protein